MVDADRATEGAVKNLQDLKNAQHDMRVAYMHGYCGVLVSGIVWLVSGLVALYVSPHKAVWTLLVGGVLIYPVSNLLNKIMGASGSHATNNPLGRLAMEGTIFMIMCIPLAYGLSLHKVEWFFLGMLLIIGGRYLTFASLYGTKLYWALGIGLGMAAYLLLILNSPSHTTVLAGAAIEITFSIVMLIKVHKRKAAIA